MKIFTIVGARPNFIKIDPKLPQTIVHTGQHYDVNMFDVFFRELGIPKPKYILNCKAVGKMVDHLIKLFNKEAPQMIVVFGDTSSSLAGAIAGQYCNIPVAHIEAGLRSHNREMPEEGNRIMIDHIAKVRFCPNYEAFANLEKEGLKEHSHIVGDPELDTLGRFLPIKPGKNAKKYNLLTVHRNFNANVEDLHEVMSACGESGEKFKFPVHPRTAEVIRYNKLNQWKNIELLPPQGYKKMIRLISDAKKVITDSGGVQREAFWMNVPVIILRDETEWPEIVTKGAGILVGTRKESILEAIKNFNGKLNSPPPFGANEKIREILYKYL